MGCCGKCGGQSPKQTDENEQEKVKPEAHDTVQPDRQVESVVMPKVIHDRIKKDSV